MYAAVDNAQTDREHELVEHALFVALRLLHAEVEAVFAIEETSSHSKRYEEVAKTMLESRSFEDVRVIVGCIQ